jgi:hypothetical protein
MAAAGRNYLNRVFNPTSVLLAALCLLGSMTSAGPATADGSGIRGTVRMGPIQPGPAIIGQDHEAPVQAAFLVLDAGKKVATFESDENGHFEIALPAGEYTIVPDASAPIFFPGRQSRTVTVPADGYAEVTLTFDTGMK